MAKSLSNDSDLPDIILEIQADIAEALNEMLQEFQEPQLMRAALMRFASLDPARKEAARKQNPEAYAELERIFNDRKNPY